MADLLDEGHYARDPRRWRLLVMGEDAHFPLSLWQPHYGSGPPIPFRAQDIALRRSVLPGVLAGYAEEVVRTEVCSGSYE